MLKGTKIGFSFYSIHIDYRWAYQTKLSEEIGSLFAWKLVGLANILCDWVSKQYCLFLGGISGLNSSKAPSSLKYSTRLCQRENILHNFFSHFLQFHKQFVFNLDLIGCTRYRYGKLKNLYISIGMSEINAKHVE